MRRINDIQKTLINDFGINIPKEKIRQYAIEGLFDFEQKKKVGSQRTFNDEQFNQAIKNIILVEFGCSESSVLSKDRQVINNHLRLINKAIKFIGEKHGLPA